MPYPTESQKIFSSALRCPVLRHTIFFFYEEYTIGKRICQALAASFKEFVCVFRDHGSKLLDAPFRRIDNEIIRFRGAPFFACNDLRVACAVFVNALDIFLDGFFGCILAVVGALDATLDLCVHFRANENAERFVIFQTNVSVPADDDAILARLGNALDDVLFFHEKRCLDLLHGGYHRERMMIRQRNGLPPMIFERIFNEIFAHIMFLRDGGDDLTVLIIISEQLGKAFAKLSASAAKFTADGDDSHK